MPVRDTSKLSFEGIRERFGPDQGAVLAVLEEIGPASDKQILDALNYKEQALINFKKAESHLGKIIQMAEANEYCVNIMQQNLAVLGLLKSANQILMQGHLNSCFKSAMQSRNSAKQNKMIKEILTVTKLSNK